jgi:hypothetical protein
MRPPVRALKVLATACALALGAGPASADFGKDEKKFPNQAYPAEFRGRVLQAIVMGANWLLTRQRDDGSFPSAYDSRYPMGPTALATLALLKSGLPAGHPKVERAFAFLEKQPLERTYEVSVLLMALDAKYDPAPDPFAKEEVDRYGNFVVPEPCAENASKEDLAWMKRCVDFLVKHQTGGYWRYPEGGFDLSNTQYALLGLKAADRCGLKVPISVWTQALDFLLSHQEESGPEVEVRANEVRGDYRIEWKEKAQARGFRYVKSEGPGPGAGPVPGPPMGPRGGAPVTGSMTTAGAAGLLICQSQLWKSRKFGAEARAKTRAGIRDAFAWMQKNFAVEFNPGQQMAHHFYYLYGLERMGILAHTRFVGKADWYLDGAEYLLFEQEPAGSWENGDLVDTCFALLFLKRSSFRTANPSITPSEPSVPSPPKPTDPAPPAMDGAAPTGGPK